MKKYSHLINVIGMIFNLILIIITFLTFHQTKRSVDISMQALEDSRKNDKITNEQSEKTFKLSQKQLERNLSKDSMVFVQVSKSTDSQIKTLKEIQNQFKISNSPFLQASDFKFYMEIGKPIQIMQTINNYGQYPSKILYVKTGHYFGSFQPISDSNLKYDPISSLPGIGGYIVRGMPEQMEIVTNTIFTKEMEDSLKKGDIFFFLFGDIIYRDEVTKEEVEYKYHIRVYYGMPLARYVVLTNENIRHK